MYSCKEVSCTVGGKQSLSVMEVCEYFACRVGVRGCGDEHVQAEYNCGFFHFEGIGQAIGSVCLLSFLDLISLITRH